MKRLFTKNIFRKKLIALYLCVVGLYLTLPEKTSSIKHLARHEPVVTPRHWCSCRPANVASSVSHGHSTCSHAATMRGPGQQVVSYALYGKFPSDYFRGLAKMAPLVAKLYPGWVMRVYHRFNLTIPTLKDWMCNLTCTYPHVDFCDVDHLPGIENVTHLDGMRWRYAVMGDPLVRRYILRDADSPILQREVDAVNQWINLGTCYHLMRDHPHHAHRLMGGMWGGCNTWKVDEIKPIRDRIITTVEFKEDDQKIAGGILLPLILQNVTEHDSFKCMHFPNALPFPTQRINRTYIGSKKFIGKYSKDALVLDRHECPIECRPKEHLDWKYC